MADCDRYNIVRFYRKSGRRQAQGGSLVQREEDPGANGARHIHQCHPEGV